MSKQLVFTRTVLIRRPADEVFAYVTDVSRAHEWRVDVVVSTAYPDGPLNRGSVIREEAQVIGRTVVTETAVDYVIPGERLGFSHLTGPLPVSGEYVLVTTPRGTELTYELVVELPGRWAMFARYLRRLGERNMTLSLAVLRHRLEEAALPASL